MKTVFVTLLVTLLIVASNEWKFRIISVPYQYYVASIDSEVQGTIYASRREHYYGGQALGVTVYVIKFLYIVDGKDFSNNLINYHKFSESVEEMLIKYPIGTDVTVYYDSQNPQWSVLEKGSLSISFYIFILINLFLAPLFGYLVARLFFK